MAALRNPNAVLAAARAGEAGSQNEEKMDTKMAAVDRSNGTGTTAGVHEGLLHGVRGESAVDRCGEMLCERGERVVPATGETCWKRCGSAVISHGVSIDLAIVWLGK